MSVKKSLNREQILSLFTQVESKMKAKNIRGTLYVVGGAAMALKYEGFRLTVDVDGIFEPADEILEIAHEVARENNLDRDWLNNAVKVPLESAGEEEYVPFDEFSTDTLSVAVASPEMLLAMKIRAGRGKDIEDAALIVKELRLKDAFEIQRIYERFFGAKDAGDWNETAQAERASMAIWQLKTLLRNQESKSNYE
ncbi:MAG: nucleotidyltransferase [Candidatus Ancillula sp.]|jgi:hypothetical protein|nr:nucleotidyltransferase [Candidatus Ancillula sp.]